MTQQGLGANGHYRRRRPISASYLKPALATTEVVVEAAGAGALRRCRKTVRKLLVLSPDEHRPAQHSGISEVDLGGHRGSYIVGWTAVAGFVRIEQRVTRDICWHPLRAGSTVEIN